MSRKTVLEAHGFSSPTEAARALGVSVQTIYNHIDRFGGLDRDLLARVKGRTTGRAVELPDGTKVSSIAKAARILGCSEQKVARHLNRHGDLRFIMEGEIRLPEVGAITDPREGPADLQLVAAPVAAPPRVRRRPMGRIDVEVVIETIRQCRDQYLEGAA
ncbi:putative replication protein [Paracoccus phage vB_PsuS_Psul1]|nr:putative replication protein [Paracoccus phage vB_PsuS_Psul1]